MQGRFADSVNATNFRNLLIQNQKLVKDHFGYNSNLEDIEAIEDMVVVNVTVDVSQNNS